MHITLKVLGQSCFERRVVTGEAFVRVLRKSEGEVSKLVFYAQSTSLKGKAPEKVTLKLKDGWWFFIRD